ncbi:hypothetical protein G6L13_30650 [Agrobacterium tumefaciens]|uniref:hypothetical protein n=1 Tax=Agrobacterium tumefaciens TaxID=358 RepID=UPI001573ED7E|nr:hypothetical protein [Agrobacterium tumefaciens]NTA84811.1 hypothetical protein [Agrobacterium tumefaciens]
MVVIDGLPKSIEVKTRPFLRRPTEITRWPVEMDKKGDADFFIFIELDLRTMAPTFYVLTNAQARAVHRDDLGGGNCYLQRSKPVRCCGHRFPSDVQPLPGLKER